MSKSDQQQPAPKELDLTHPSVARVYDYLLGGDANWAVDREFAERALASHPLLRGIARANRLFLHRAVRHLTRLGVRQFIDIGAGVPTMGNTHQIAQAIAPDAKVVYIDHEPIAVAHGNLLLERENVTDRHAVVAADLREPDRLWEQVDKAGKLDLNQPVAVLIVAVLHVAQPNEDGVDVGPKSVERYRELMAPGSYLAISQVCDEGVPESMESDLVDLKRMYDSAGSPVIWRKKKAIEAVFGDFELIEPGTCWTPEWHPEEAGEAFVKVSFATPNESAIWCGVGRKP